MTPQQLRQKYRTLETELFLEAARGNVPSYHEFILRFAELDGRFADEARQNRIITEDLDPDVTVQYQFAEEDGVPLRDYAYRWLTVNNDLTVNIRIEEASDDE